jgi:hypothetical protein
MLVDKPLSLYKYFDLIEMFLLIPSALGSIASIVALYYTIKGDSPPIWAIAIFCLVIVLTIAIVFLKVSKFKVLRSQSLSDFCRASHDICHEMRDKFFELFEKRHAGEYINLTEAQRSITDFGASLLSNHIHRSTGANVVVVVKLFCAKNMRENVFKDQKDISKKDFRIKLENSKVDLVTSSVFKNGNRFGRLPMTVDIKSHSMYSYALSDILYEEDGRFLASNTKSFITKALNESPVDTQFKNPGGSFKLHRRSLWFPKLVRVNGEPWYNVQKGVIAVPISDERHQKNDLENSKFYGIIKVGVDSDDVLKKSSDQEAFVYLAKGFGDTMFKCLERIDYYVNEVRSKQNAN